VSVNVQCAGGGQPPHLTAWSPIAKRYVLLADGDPCGWKGKRKTLVYAPVTFTFASGGKQVEDRWLPKDPTADPCPRCDGRVELIPGDTS
jgi:hypothetical protein